MHVFRRAAVLAASLSFVFATPALADDPWPVDSGDYVEIGMITVDDGHDLEYLNHLAGLWRKSQDHAKAQGWITGYEILTNENKRPGEPDYFLVTRFASLPDAAEQKRRSDVYFAYMQTTTNQQLSASGQRATYRKVIGSQLLRALVWKKK